MKPVTAIAFDADDTLWHTERVFRLTQERFAALLALSPDRASGPVWSVLAEIA